MNGFGRDEKKEKKEKSRASVMTRETVGMTLLLFSAVMFLICVTGEYLFGEIGVAITAFCLGIFGFLTYPLLLYMVYQSFVLVFGKGKISWRWKLRVAFLLISVFLIVQVATSEKFYGNGYGNYLSGCWNAAGSSAAEGTGGGVVLGFIAYPIRALLSPAGAYVVFVALTLVSVILILLKTPLRNYIKGVRFVRSRKEKKQGFDPNEEFPEEGRKSSAATFEDLAPPVRRIPSQQESLRQTPQVRPERASSAATRSLFAAKEPTEHKIDKDRSKEILFGADPQEIYRNNLIFSHDSYFNSRERSSSLYREEPRANAVSGSANTAESYSSRYTAAAETGTEPMPRRISEDKPAVSNGYTYSSVNDVSYSQTPSYRAEPQKPEPARRNCYDRDVPYNEEFSSVPNVCDDNGAKEEPKSNNFIPEPEAPAYEPVRNVSAEDTPAQDIFARTARESLKEEPQEEPAVDYNSESSIRSLFGRSVGEDRTTFPRGIESDDDFRASRSERAFSSPEFNEGRGLREEEKTVTRDEGRSFLREERPIAREETRSFPREEEKPAAHDETRGFSRGEEFSRGDRRSAADLFDDDDESDSGDFRRDESVSEPPPPQRTRTVTEYTRREREERIAPASAEAAPAPEPKRHIYRQYVAPDYSLFRDYNDSVMVPQEEINRNSQAIEECLAGFKIDAEVVKVTCGATVTRYDLAIPGNVSVNTVVKRDEEIAMRLHASDGVNVYANRANGTVSVDVPNATSATVGLRSLLYAPEYVNSKPGSLMFVIGKDVEGKPVIGNIVKMKQLLVAGTTGSGKSVCLHSMLISLICKYSPEDLRLILIDPKGEFTIYEGLPHLMINEIISDAQKAVTALNWAIKEMERRYALFQQKTRSGVLARNIDEYNANLTEDEQKLCKIVIVVDELADLMSVAKKDIEERIQRLTQKSRAAGIHLVISTQRPSVDVITGVIKGNLPTRMALRVIQEVDSRTIIDETGAQKLLGNGDMLFRTEGMFNCQRVQGAFLSSKEVEQIVANVKANNEAYFDTEISDYINNPGQSGASSGDDMDDDAEVGEQYIKALGIVVRLGTASISLIQRKCSVGYNHAGKIMEWMELMGYVSPFDGKAKARTVLLTKEEYESKYGSLD